MIIKLFNAFLFGTIFVLLLDFLLFVGLKINYFDPFGIDEYFNILFMENQPFLLLMIVSTALGYAMLYLKHYKVFDRLYIVLILIFGITFYEPVGKAVGKYLFLQKDQRLQVLDRNITTDILYQNNKAIYIKKPHLNHTTKIYQSELN